MRWRHPDRSGRALQDNNGGYVFWVGQEERRAWVNSSGFLPPLPLLHKWSSSFIKVMLSFIDLYAKYNCTYCQEDITGLRVKCVECPDFDLCLQVSRTGTRLFLVTCSLSSSLSPLALLITLSPPLSLCLSLSRLCCVVFFPRLSLVGFCVLKLASILTNVIEISCWWSPLALYT